MKNEKIKKTENLNEPGLALPGERVSLSRYRVSASRRAAFGPRRVLAYA